MMIDNIKKRIRSKNIYKNFFMFIMGCLIAGISVSVFYNPNNVVTTGCTGLSILINRYTHIDLSLIVLVFSSILLVVGFMVFGIEYGVKNILGTILFPIFIKATRATYQLSLQKRTHQKEQRYVLLDKCTAQSHSPEKRYSFPLQCE